MASKILLADDSITIQKVVNLTFADEGIDVVAVNNGDVAERRMEEVKPDLVLADIFMPGKNGYELCESIKNSQFRNVPVVLLVGAFEPFDQTEAKRVRADAHLTKPFESRTLVETVRKLINSTAQPTGGPVAAMPAPSEMDDMRSDGQQSIRDERDTGPIETRLTAPAAPRLDLSAMMTDATSTPVTARTTAELSPRMSDLATEGFEVSVAAAPSSDTITATLIDTDEPFGTMELTSSGFNSEQFASTLGLEPAEPVLDFERTDLESSAVEQALAFDMEPGGPLDIAESGLQEFDSVEAASEEMLPESAWHQPQPEAQSEPAFEAPSPGLLAVEEPLGDLLEETSPVEAAPARDSFVSDSLSLDLAEPEATSPDDAASTSFDVVDALETSQAPPEVAKMGDETHPSPPQRPADWTSPQAASYSTAQLDSVVMPVEAAEFLSRMSAEEPAPPEVAQEASFSNQSPWGEEEAQFTAIDIEAVSVEEPEVRGDTSTPSETGQVEMPASTSQAAPANGASASSELSAAAIDAIVRRVITEMSDSVVREVAWEVVPDCVERVVDQLTRESLSRRA